MALCIFITFSIFVLFLIPSTFSLSFNISSIDQMDSRSINATFDSYISPQGIQLTPDERNVTQIERAGRATYIEPLHLWDKASGNLTDFSTHFSFVIDSRGDTNFADGLTFFMAPVYSSLSSQAYGGSMGLNTDNRDANSSAETFFAVEFDTFLNWFDPRFTHVGININSMVSVVTQRWWNDMTKGYLNDAWINYNGSSMLLNVGFTGNWNNSIQRGNLSYVVDLRYLPEKVIFGFSAATGTFFETHNIKSWEFSSSLQLDASPKEPTPSPIPETKPNVSDGKENNKGLVTGLGVGLSILVLASVLGGYFLWKKKRNEETRDEFFDPSMDNEFERGSGAKKFSYNELAQATENFADHLKLGEGGFGGVYRGFLKESNSYVAVKRVSRGSKQGVKEYASEVKIINQLRHKNLVQLMGWCHERGELLLVYELLPNGSLDSHIFKQESVLSWDFRYKIAQGLASALLYLHEEWERCVVHRDIKCSNVMLDSNFNAKLGDFGLARLVDHGIGAQTTILAGTMGYLAPECVITGRASKESDVYSFGVVLLEMACGRRPIDLRGQENEVRLVEWVWSLYGKKKLLDAVDRKLGQEYDAREIETLMVVGLWCVHPDDGQRPSIRQVVNVLNFEAQLPILPSMMPVPTYGLPEMNIQTILDPSSSIVSDHSYFASSSNVTTSSAGSNSDPSAALLIAS